MTGLDADHPDQPITFAATHNDWGGRPMLDGVEYVYIPEGDEEAGLNAYKNDDVGIAWFPAHMFATIKDDPVLGQELLQYSSGGRTRLAST
jgi:ABC-type transport system substrate-binding protein